MGKLLSKLASASSVSFLLLTLASARSQKARFYLNSLLYMLSMGVCSSLGVVYAICLSLVPGKRFNTNYLVARSFYAIAGTLIGYNITVEGAEHLQNRPSIMLGNHQSVLDILYLGRVFPPGSIIMAKKELKLSPLLGQFMMLGGNAFIDRKSRASAIKTMSMTGQHMRKNKLALFMFPEGTRSHMATPGLLPLKKGAFHLAIQTQLPIIPIVCENYHRMFDSKTRFDGGELRVAVLPPIETKGLTDNDVDQLLETVERQMKDRLVRFDQDLDRRDSDLAAHPSNQPSPTKVYGLAGLAARLIGTGKARSHVRNLQNISNDQRTPLGQNQPSDYGLVSASQAPEH
ncbi:1-acylglycerol-3-phosphate O-acyltransferase [Malassezia caprae]|uniref:1-acyl-sn-glycerol-3-phosphate acyltransferase n=1 Tax=Malassezia caprae TaxID=1381934 RepID=A0AAF0E7V5_9BASI|nr:1-acylglycerol-3-phosphate O-acyltransferase [Malassezia caprae]